jgi:hypothetical protein
LQAVGATSAEHDVLLLVVLVAAKVAGSVRLLTTGGLIVLFGVVAAMETTGAEEVLERAPKALIVLFVVEVDVGNDDQ